MENLSIKGNSKTPDIDFNLEGTIKIKGRSIPEDAGLFYNHLYTWIIKYCMDPKPSTKVDMELEYMNSGSSKSILQILRELINISNNNCTVNINWYYEIGDDDMHEKGEYFEAILKHPFNFIETY